MAMKLLATILVGCVSTLACSSKKEMKREGGVTDGGTVEVGLDGDAGIGDTAIADSATGDTATGDANDAGTARAPLCDGVAHLRLWAYIVPGDELRGSIVRVENGYPFIAIDGTCSYWIGGGWTEVALSRDRPIRTGKIPAEDVATIEQQVPLDDLTPLRDCPPPPPGLYDYSFRVFRTATAEASCFTAAPALTAGTDFEAAWLPLEAIAMRLWNDGTPLDGAVHVSAAVMGSGVNNQPPYAWPIPASLASFVVADGDLFKRGVSRLVDDPAATSALRALRDQYLSDRTAQPGLFANWDGLGATDQTTTAWVYMRDAMPYEDAQGLLSF
jgi:hypothetical protein